jgi:uncharacterized protein YaaQ
MSTKMLIAILQDEDTDRVTTALVEMGFRVTRIASTGGFIRQGKSTVMVGLPNEMVDQAIQIINNNCAPTIEPVLKRATVFVLNVEHFEQI